MIIQTIHIIIIRLICYVMGQNIYNSNKLLPRLPGHHTSFTHNLVSVRWGDQLTDILLRYTQIWVKWYTRLQNNDFCTIKMDLLRKLNSPRLSFLVLRRHYLVIELFHYDKCLSCYNHSLVRVSAKMFTKQKSEMSFIITDGIGIKYRRFTFTILKLSTSTFATTC